MAPGNVALTDRQRSWPRPRRNALSKGKADRLAHELEQRRGMTKPALDPGDEPCAYQDIVIDRAAHPEILSFQILGMA
jgi:hypothetical protein